MIGNHLDSPDAVVTLPSPEPLTPGGAADEPPPANPLLRRLLHIADGYRAENAVRQATALYFELVEQYPGAPEAQLARQRLLAIGEQFERGGEFRQARGLYERLL